MKERLIRVEIVAAVHNRRDLTLRCLRSVSRLDRAGLEIGVVIVDDGSTDGTSEAIASEFPDVDVVISDGNLWYTEGTNVGIRRALKRKPDYVLIINDDQVFDEKCLRYLVEIAESVPNSVVGPLLLLWDTPHRVFQVSPRWETWNGGWRHWYSQTIWTVPERPWKVDLIVGNCVLVSAKILEKHGLMNSVRYPNFGDAEFTPRLKKAGCELLIDPRARVFCQPNAVPARVRGKLFNGVINDLVLDLRNVHNLRRRLYGYLDGAPSSIKGLAAFAIFLGRAVFGKTSEKSEWGKIEAEPPLKETYANRTIR